MKWHQNLGTILSCKSNSSMKKDVKYAHNICIGEEYVIHRLVYLQCSTFRCVQMITFSRCLSFNARRLQSLVKSMEKPLTSTLKRVEAHLSISWPSPPDRRQCGGAAAATWRKVPSHLALLQTAARTGGLLICAALCRSSHVTQRGNSRRA